MLSSLLLPSVGRASTSYYIETAQTGAQTQIDALHTSNWDFTPTWGWNLGGGVFVMKAGSSTVGAITLTLYDLTDNLTVESISLTQTSFGNNYAPVTFAFTVPDTLTPAINYRLQLTSGVPNIQSQAYFIKDNGTFSIADSQGNALPSGPVPEPSTWAMVLLGCGAIVAGTMAADSVTR